MSKQQDELLDNLLYYRNAMRMVLAYNKLSHSPSLIVSYDTQIDYIQNHIDATLLLLEALDE